MVFEAGQTRANEKEMLNVYDAALQYQNSVVGFSGVISSL